MENSLTLHLHKLKFPSTKDALGQAWLNWSKVSGEEVKNMKSLQIFGQTDRQTDGRQLIRRFQRRRGVNRYPINNKIKHICHLCNGLT